MPRIRVEAPSQHAEEVVDLRDGHGVILGRSPDLSRLDGVGGERMLARAVASPSVSGNHLAAWADAGQLHLRDLGSRNGSWLRLPEGVTVAVPASEDTHVRLAFTTVGDAVGQPIAPPPFDQPHAFGADISTAIRTWFADHGVQVRIAPAREGTTHPTGTITLPLASGETLCIQADQTLEERFQDLMVTAARYVTAQNTQYRAEEETRRDGMILTSTAIREVHRCVVDAAMRQVPRLVLLGPSGAGKECLARAYHRHLDRSGQLVTVNCATLNRERIVADLFGAEAGAYTGAQRTMIGAVERADGGTLFLDEVGEIPLEVQAQLLRFLDTGEYQRLGSVGVNRTANVCIVAATNRNLREMVNHGTFRLDLFFRIALEIVEVPPLRDRFADAIAFLASQALGATTALDALQPQALELLRQHGWVGNFRELVNLVQRLPRPARAGSIDVEAIRRLLGAGALVVAPAAPAPVVAEVASDWIQWLRLSADAYCSDHGTSGPATWGEVSTFIEQYLKPHAIVHMAGVDAAPTADAVSIAKVADAVKADRGTVIKQLRRYFESRH